MKVMVRVLRFRVGTTSVKPVRSGRPVKMVSPAGPVKMVRSAGLRRFSPVYRSEKIPLAPLRFWSKNEFHNFLGMPFFLSQLHREQV
jgi:hypothetical protein